MRGSHNDLISTYSAYNTYYTIENDIVNYIIVIDLQSYGLAFAEFPDSYSIRNPYGYFIGSPSRSILAHFKRNILYIRHPVYFVFDFHVLYHHLDSRATKFRCVSCPQSFRAVLDIHSSSSPAHRTQISLSFIQSGHANSPQTSQKATSSPEIFFLTDIAKAFQGRWRDFGFLIVLDFFDQFGHPIQSF